MRTQVETWVMGFGGSSHDFSTALARGYDIKVAVEEERLSRRKYGQAWWYQNPLQKGVAYCLETCGITFDEIEAVVSSDLIPERVLDEYKNYNLKIYPHHLCHAASTTLLLPSTAHAAIIVIDGMGSIRKRHQRSYNRETISFFEYYDGRLTCKGETFGNSLAETGDYQQGCSNSIGHLYEIVTLELGFSEFQEGKTMGLAAYGQPRYLQQLMDLVDFNSRLDFCFECDPLQSDIQIVVQDILQMGGWDFPVKADMAASIQALMEQVIKHCFNLVEPWNTNFVCVAGGCGLNSVANGKLASIIHADQELIIPPFTSDSGLGLGAIYLWNKENNSNSKLAFTFNGRNPHPALARPGRQYSSLDCMRAAQSAYPRLAEDSSVSTPKELAQKLANGKLVGLFQGRSEIGPRALGGRSILADPRKAEIRERINRIIKHREPFRPLAPLVLESDYDRFFSGGRLKDPYMLKVSEATNLCRRLAPAIVHVDGTSRVQCVSKLDDVFLINLLTAFKELTGLPMLMNTSFNRCGEPIVETPQDAVDCFLGLDLDGLYLQDRYYFKPGS